MMGDDLDDASVDMDTQSRWGEGLSDRAMRKLYLWLEKARDRLLSLETDRDAGKTAIQDLRARVKALEDKAP